MLFSPLRLMLCAGLVAFSPALVSAHFPFILPGSGENSCRVILSETLELDADVDITAHGKLTLSARDAVQVDTTLTLKAVDHEFQAPLPEGSRSVWGQYDYGVMKRGEKAALLRFYPKAILGTVEGSQKLGQQKLELVPIVVDGDVHLRLLNQGSPLANSEVTLIAPDGESQQSTTDQSGQTGPLKAPGQWGAWARLVEAEVGESAGEGYEEIRHYATLVLTVSPPTPSETFPNLEPPAVSILPLPQAVSSFGAVATPDWLYVYGGHIAKTHSYDTTAVTGKFHRLNLKQPTAWESLAEGTSLQGLNLAASGERIYRVGGMKPLNAPSEKVDNVSVAESACFDPAVGKWQPLPDLPVARSSHDVAVVGNKLYVIGGWSMHGEEGEDWLEEMLTLDLTATDPQWQSLPQPFARRALIVAVVADKMYVIGGFTEEGEPSRAVNVYDPGKNEWTLGPKIPGDAMNGFAPAAAVHRGSLYLSVASGGLYRLAASGDAWEAVGRTTPRIVHRMISTGEQLWLLGGAAKGDNLDLIEAVTLP